jgi:hypothetical protein
MIDLIQFTAEALSAQRYFFLLLSVERTESKKQSAQGKLFLGMYIAVLA